MNISARERPEPLRIGAPARADFQAILSSEALEFLAALNTEFGGRVAELLQARAARKRSIEAGERLDFLPATRSVRESAWSIAPVPDDLLDRRVEITGPTRSQDDHQRAEFGRAGVHGRFRGLAVARPGTTSSMASINLLDAVRRTIDLVSPEGKVYRLNEQDRGARRAAARLAFV